MTATGRLDGLVEIGGRSSSLVERVLGRPEREIRTGLALEQLATRRILVTGGSGSIGKALTRSLQPSTTSTDLDDLDVRRRSQVVSYLEEARPNIVFHLAGAKHAPHGELDPWAVTETNTVGTRNLLDAAGAVGARVVLASTCKACDPETAYGASKLLAERMVLNAGGSVARFFNVVESAGNVFETWSRLDADADVPVTSCRRFFISAGEAVALLVWSAVLPAGRYAVAPGDPRWMRDVASDLFPGRSTVRVERRRGDREIEPLIGASERAHTGPDWLLRITSPHEVAA